MPGHRRNTEQVLYDRLGDWLMSRRATMLSGAERDRFSECMQAIYEIGEGERVLDSEDWLVR